jgi:P4 family phage/plasmid primase-like protien
MTMSAPNLQKFVPDELRLRSQWLVWKFEQKPEDKKPRKVPYYAASATRRMGTQGSDDDRAKLVGYDLAVSHCNRLGFDGVGFAFLPGDGLIGIDLDACITGDPEKVARAAKILAACNSFSEYSPSGNGMHIFAKGQCETFKSNLLGIEVFCGRQFFTFTGNHIPSSPMSVADMPADTLDKLRKTVKSTNSPERAVSIPMPPSDAAKVESALAMVSADLGYEEWLRIGMAVHNELGDSGFSVWDYWSQKSNKYSGQADLLSHWRSFGPGSVTGGTLFKMAMDNGWRPPSAPRGHIRTEAAQQPVHTEINYETGEITEYHNDNQSAPTPESVLSQFFVIQGQSWDGTYWIYDKRRSKLARYKNSALARKVTLIELAPASAWSEAIDIRWMAERKFTAEPAMELIIEIAAELPTYQPEPTGDTEQKQELTGKHGADSAVIANSMREETLYDEYRTTWYAWDSIWRPVTEGDVNRRIIYALDLAFKFQYDRAAFAGTFELLKKRLGRSPQISDKQDAVFDTWNKDKKLLPMRNGVLNMETMDLLPHSPDLMMNWLIPYDYDPEASAPVTQGFLRELSQGDENTEAVLYAFLCAVLHGRCDLQVYLECVGVAGTGKSTYIKLCQLLVGDLNVAITNMKQLHENRFETANLYGKRLVVISDADKYGGSVDIFKAITGEDTVRYEEKNKQAGTGFIYGGMVIAAANQPIQFNDSSTAMVRRRVPIHLDKRLDKSKIDQSLSDKMRDEIPGLINKLLTYDRSHIERTLKDRDGLRSVASNRAMCETNSIAAWLNECVIQDINGSAKIGGADHSPIECLYPSYAAFSGRTGRKGVLSLQSFGRSTMDILGHAGINVERRITNKGAHIWGIRLRGQFDDEVRTLLLNEPHDMHRANVLYY